MSSRSASSYIDNSDDSFLDLESIEGIGDVKDVKEWDFAPDKVISGPGARQYEVVELPPARLDSTDW